MNMRYRLIVTVLLTVLMAVGNASAGVKVHGNVYGGGNAADVGTDATVNIGAGQIGVNQVDAEHGNVFGGGKGQVTTVVGDVKVNIGKKVTISNGQTTISYSDDCLVKGSVYGGSALGAVNATKANNWDKDHLDRISATSGKTTEVNIFAGTVNENVYGGGRGQTGDDAIAAKSFGEVSVTIGDANVNKTVAIDGSVYGGSDANGVLESNVTVDVIRGTIGKSTTENGTTTITGGNVHGGGYGQPTLVKGDVTVNIGATDGAPTPTYSGSATILGDVYGGSAKGNVNAYINSNVLTVSTYPDPTDELKTLKRETKVNLFGGTISGDLYGGGLGDNTVTPKVAANVYGPVTVTVQGGTVQNVFGCNNKYGSPQDDVVVDIYKTAHTTDNQYPTVTDLNGLNRLSNDDDKFAILAVYGGGNLASYTPPAIGNNSYHSTTVHVYGCTENTVKTVYGGGNAADVGTKSVSANTNVIIEGGRFDRIFGGGNGYSAATPPNHTNPSGDDYNPGANIYGTATTEIRGGLFNQVFGGSNQYGNITSASLTINKLCDQLMIKESFGGANEADLSGNVETTLDCSEGIQIGNFYGGSNQADINGNVTLNVYGGTYTNVFGGSKGMTPPANATDEQKAAAAADISGNVTLNLYGGTMDNAFGGSDVNGNIGGKITVNMLDKEVSGCGLIVHNIYGGGRDAAYTPTTPGAYPEVNLIHGTVSKKAVTSGNNTTYTGGNVFGGGLGNTAVVTSNPKVNVGYATTMSTLVTSLLPSNTSLTTANVTVEGNVYGGGDAAAVTGNTSVTLQKHTAENFTSNSTVSGDIYGGGNLADVSGNSTVNITGGTVTQDVYGGGALANVGTANASNTTQVTVSGGSVRNVYGGGLGRNADNTNSNNPISAVEAKVFGAVTVTVTGGNATNVYGCNNLNGAPQSTVAVNINGTAIPTAQANYTITNVFGGGNQAAYTGTPVVSITGSSYVENVFGGGNEASVGATNVTINTTANTSNATNSGIAKVFGGGNQAGVTGNTSVSMTGGNVNTAMYGGCNSSGTVGGTSTVDVTGGTIGSAFSAPSKMDDVPNVLFGGGMGAATRITGKTTVTIGSKTETSGANPTTTYGGTATIYGNVYGGSENGAVSDVDVKLYGTTHGNTNIIYGNVFGGGYDTDSSLAPNGTLASHAPAAGVVNVLLDGAEFDRTNANNAYMAQIFGCNNKNGTPTGLVTVNVKRTTGSTKNADILSIPIEHRAYDVYAVYGGGNMADYKPNGANDSTLVVIEGCNETSIKYVYGGGNAAAVPATGVEIKGTYIIDKVFGGGNGAGQIPGPNDTMIDNPGANVGSYIVSANNKPTYGRGTAVTKLYGGTINEVYGGSNTLGDIRKVIVETKTPGTSRPDCCAALNVINMYGAGSEAEMTGDVNIIMECSPVAYVDAVYGGAKNAVINGNVTLTVTSGKYGRVFGGNNEGGSINGIITVNVKEDGCDDLEIGELYGAGNQAPYSRFGCTGSNGNWTPNETNTNNFEVTFDQNEQYPYHVRVFVESCTSIGKIFGGGLGTTAKVIGDTYVSVNMMYGSVNNVPKTTLGRIGQVFGGGALADVKGNTKINIGTATASEDIGVNIVGTVGTDNKYINPVPTGDNGYTSIPYISITDAGVYGGGMNADVDGDTEVNIGTADQKLHVGETNECAGITINGNIYGGGYGSGTHVTGNVRVNIGEQDATTSDYVGYANITGDVYGGSAMGKVNSSLVNNVETQTTGKTTQVNFYGGTITGDLYGGGLGDADHAADVYGPVTVNVYEGCSSTANVNNHVNNVFGCNNTNGTPKRTVIVNIYGGTVSKSVYGGGNQAIMDGSPVVNVTGGTIGTANLGGAVYGNVYGGGLGSDGTGSQTDLNKVKAGLVKGNTTINISGGNILHNIYGGGAYGSVGTFTYNNTTTMPTGLETVNTGKATINITGGTIGTSGKENGMVFGSSRGDVGAPNSIHDKLAWVYDTEVKIGTQNDETDGPTINGSVYGGGENGHNYRNADVYIYSGKIGINNNATVSYNDDPDHPSVVTYTGKDYNYSYRGNVYGAGCGTDKYDTNSDGKGDTYNPLAGIVQGNTTITMSGGTVIHNIYGAGAMGSVGTADVAASGVTTINISGGEVGVNGTIGGGNVFGAARGDADATSNEYALVRNHTSVNISDGTIYGNVYGGGELGCVGRYKFTSDMKEFYWTDQALVANQTSYTYNNTGVCNVNITGGVIGIDGNSSPDHGNVFGGGKGKEDTFWCEKGMVYQTNVSISKGTVYGSVYGGGEVGRVEQNTDVKIGPDSGDDIADIKGDVFGAGKGLDTHGYSALVRGNAYVTVQGKSKVGGSVYGGGEIASVGRHLLVTEDNKDEHPDLEVGMPYTLANTNVGRCFVTVKGNSEITGNVFGAGKGVKPQDITNPGRMTPVGMEYYNATDYGEGYEAAFLIYVQTLALVTDTQVTIGGEAGTTKVKGSVYGGSESGFVQFDTDVKTIGISEIGTANSGGDIYGGGLGIIGNEAAGRVKGSTNVAITGAATIRGSVYGGGENGIVKESTVVNIGVPAVGETAAIRYMGTISKDVYGGGKAADVCQNVTVNVNSGTVTNDVYGGGALANTNIDNWNANGFEEVSGLTAGTSIVTGLYSAANDGSLIDTENQTADANTTYYQKGTWASGKNDPSTGTTYKTTVNLTGGLVGNAYGGALGRKDIAGSAAVPAHGEPGDPDYTPEIPAVAAVTGVAAMVYGDVTVTVNGAKFHQETADEKEKVSFVDEGVARNNVPITKYGRVFGANNANGTPKGNIMVNVKQTVPEEDGAVHTYGYYEIHSVYGGGNLANYLPADGKNTQVLIEGCEDTSIECVYGGGNSASVPQTLVTINGTFEIGMIFGGGNGDDPVKDASGNWGPNPGADVIKVGGVAGTGTINAKGGIIRWLYGGSNKKGLCGHIQENLDPDPLVNCPLKITNVYGAGKNADVESVFIVAKCPSSFGETVEYLYGGSYNARISGDVTMTLIGGQYKNVYGGNDSGGSIGGNITINIQETYDCDPIIIGNLYGGGNRAAYPGNSSANGSITINVKSCTHIGNIFGGGFGGEATVNGTTQVNLNMTKGLWATDKNNVPFVLSRDKADFDGKTNEQIKNAIEAEIPNIEVVDLTNATFDREKYTIKCKVKNELGTIGNVYGGGDEAAVHGTTEVNIGTQSTVAIMQHNNDGVPVKNNGTAESPVYIPIFDNDGKLISGYTYADIAYTSTPVLGANITGNVYGGGNNANVTENTYVNICAKENTTTHEYESVTLASGAVGVTIEGTERHGVFGGGNLGIVEGDTYIHQGGGNVNQSVYGGGCEADVKGNTYVTMLDGYVEDGVYGGGLMGSVGTFTRAALPSGHTNHDGCVGGKPDTFTDDTGKCTVVISGGQIGPDAAANNGMTANEIVDVGFVFGAGRGDVENPDVDPDADFHTYVNETDVTIKGTALIMASVYGGGENGRVRGNTLVKIEGGQIGCGDGSLDNGKAKPYKESLFIDPTEASVTEGLSECSHWPYGRNTAGTGEDPNWVYETYDPYADDAPLLYPGGSSAHPSDGKTYYGCVFGGGSGYYPYEKAKSGGKVTNYDWLPSAGLVEGNTVVRITGGHILTNVYGGNEYTDVLGSCTVTMSGGTIGVPRTIDQINTHPLTCYLFGAGKGDPRSHFNGMTNVGSVNVEVSGGIIYGSVFGGAEDGHVVGDVDVQIKPGAVIGTWGTSYVDGNVFGGGRGFSGENVLAGNVGGDVTMTISGGTMLGSIYGGGRLGSVGLNTSNSEMLADVADNTGTPDVNESQSHGHVTINITGGTIGNTNEYKFIAPNVTGDALTTATANMPNTLLESNNRLKHTKGGNVFAGGMGRRKKLDTVTDITNWTKLGNVKSTKLTISGDNTWIMGNVYGGGEFGAVTGSHTSAGNTDVGTEIIVTGGTIGTEITENTPQKATVEDANTVKYTFGSVYGGGMGSEDHDASDNHGGNVTSNTSVSISGANTKVRASVYGGGEMAAVESDTHVTVSDGEIGRNEVKPLNSDDPGYVMFGGAMMGNVYGGGKGHVDHTLAGLVKGDTYVTISGGSIYHNVYGGGALGSVGTFTLADKVAYIPDGVPLTPWKSGGTTYVTITGGTIGISGRDNGMVNGSSRGDVAKPVDATMGNPSTTILKDPYDKVAWIKDSRVTIGTDGASTGPIIKGSVYGGGENGHNAGDAYVTVYSGTIGIADTSDPWYTFNDPAIAEKALVTRGNVYGAGCGTDTYWDDADNDEVVDAGEEHNNTWAGLVAGNTYVTVHGGEVTNNVYGGGSMGSVGTVISDLDGTSMQHRSADNADLKQATTLYDFGLSWPLEITYGSNTGTANVTIDGTAQIDNYVFGGARGKVEFGVSDITEHRYEEAKHANVRMSKVVIGTENQTDHKKPTIRTVYGGGEDGHVMEDAQVTINGGTINRTVFGGGKGTSTFKSTLWDANNEGHNKKDSDGKDIIEDVHSWTAGKVYGNTNVTINGGSVGWFVYGGGNMASVGKGNYSGGHDDYAPKGYGELPSASGNLWTTAYTEQSPTKDMAWHFLNSGITTVNILGGTVGTTEGSLVDNTYKSYDESGVPYGSVFGGSRGKAAATCILSPRYKYVPDFFLGYVNKAIINIGGTSATSPSANSPTIYGSVYGGGQDGHVRNSTEVHIFKGNIAGQAPTTDTSARSGHVFGAGSGIGTYHDNSDNKDKCNNSSGSVTCTTLVEVYGENNDNESTATTKIKGNIYGGGAMASVGPPNTGAVNGQGFDEYEDLTNYTRTGDFSSYTAHGSKSYTQVDIKGGRIGGSVFAASRGPSDAFRKQSFDDKDIDYDPYSYATVLWPNVHVSGGKIVGSVYGGGETGYVKCGVNVDITGGTIDTDVYGGGAMAHTNIGNLKQDRETKVWSWTDNTNRTAKYTTIVNLLGGTIGGDAYGGGLGRREYGTSGQDGYESAVEAKVYGDVRVNLNGLETADYNAAVHGATSGESPRLVTVTNGGRSYYQLNTANRGAVVNRVFGCNNLLGSPQGKVRVHVFATQPAKANTTIKEADKYTKFGKISDYTITNYSGLTSIAQEVGLNVSTYTTTLSGSGTNADKQEALESMKEAIANEKYDVHAVYGGGNLAAYMPMGSKAPGTVANIINDDYKNTKQTTEVIIDGCGLTSIKQVYGGGNAASVPATYLEVNGTYEVDEAFGGGNGADAYKMKEGNTEIWHENPGANVGYENFAHYVESTAVSSPGTQTSPYYLAVDNSDASTPEARKQNYAYGHKDTGGVATTKINGGKIHAVYGGSNKKGNISTTAVSQYEGASECPMDVDETYGAGKDAPIDGVVDLKLKCAKGVKEMFGGAKNSDVNSDIVLTITNGSSLERVFGGNNTSGAIAGSITVNIEEGGCEPIRIGELYAGGYLAPYSIYGYERNNDGSYKSTDMTYDGVGTISQRIPLTKEAYETYKQTMENHLPQVQADLANPDLSDELRAQREVELAFINEIIDTYPKKNPRINVISATRIDNIYGGGYKAEVIGDPHINVNMTNGFVEVTNTGTESEPVYKDAAGNVYSDNVNDYVVTLPVGTIGNIYGGGNMADIDGDTYVEIGTGKWLKGGTNDVWETNGTTSTITTPTTFTYDSTQEKWTYETTKTVSITGEITPEEGSLPETPEENDQIRGTCDVDGITTPTIFTYHSNSWTYETTETVTIDEDPTPSRNEATIIHRVDEDNKIVEGGYVYGGGNEADVKGNTNVTMANGSVENTIYGGGNLGAVGTYTYDATREPDYEWTAGTGVSTLNITGGTVGPEDTESSSATGNVYGGGKGKDDTFTCEKGMVLKTDVSISNGTVKGNVYGGGQIARVENDTKVTIGLESGSSAPVIGGDVFGAGMGVDTHGYSGLVRGNSYVTIQGDAQVNGSVYGGGEKASVGRFWVATSPELAQQHGVEVGEPYDLKNGGTSTVIIRGNAVIGPDDMRMTASNGPDDHGHVFGAGKGVLPYDTDNPGRYYMKKVSDTASEYTWESYAYDADKTAAQNEEIENNYLKYTQTLGITNKSDVTIGGNAFVKGSVYGGSENGHVREDTHVTIAGGQIGNGHILLKDATTGEIIADCGVNRPYTADEWSNGSLTFGSDDLAGVSNENKTLVSTAYSASLPECASWPYEAPYAPYDKFANASGYYDNSNTVSAGGGRPTGSDGHTFYGNVFGGGSGYYPYKPGKWHRGAGSVGGNTVVDITGGHILTSVYGGNEMTDVGTYTKDANDAPIVPKSGGKCTINMVGGTLGVPRTLEQITAHPVTCYLFGAGKGDQRVFFNTWTNVKETFVNVTGTARIYGSVFGGGEDGHVINNAVTTIGGSVSIDLNGDGDTTDADETFTAQSSLKIGTTGTSYVDGNIFGAGRGFSGDALTAGSVGGNVEVNIEGGTMLGSVYGGGRLASVGIPFTSVNSSQYGLFTEDVSAVAATYYQEGDVDIPEGKQVGDVKTPAVPAKTYGHVTVNISGGTIGNDTDQITVEHTITHTKGGNVYGGGMGRLTLLNDNPAPKWPQLGQVKSATINIYQKDDNVPTIIKGNVYGGGELGTVRDNTTIVVGKESKTATTLSKPTILRDIYGGGYGSEIEETDNGKSYVAYVESQDGEGNPMIFRYTPIMWAGMVGKGTEVNIYDGWVKRNVYGGGELASVGIIDYTVALTELTSSEAYTPHDYIKDNKHYSASYNNIVKHDDEANSFALSWPYKTEYFPGYTGDTYINVYGGRLGISDDDMDWEDNGDIYGGSKGKAGDRYEMAFCGNVGSSNILIDYPDDNDATPANHNDQTAGDYPHDCIVGAVYGGGEDGHVMGDTHVTLKNGLIGHAMYGGGSGKGKYAGKRLPIGATPKEGTTNQYDESQFIDPKPMIYSLTSGKVYGDTHVKMEGGYVVRFVYGGGNMGSVGKGNYSGGADDYYKPGYGETITGNLWTSTYQPNSENSVKDNAWYFLNSGKTEVEIIGGQIGYVNKDKPKKSMKDGLPYGSVFGGSRGESAPNIRETPRYYFSPEFFSGYVNETQVTIGGYRCNKADNTYKEGDCLTAVEFNDAFPSGNTDWELVGPKILGSVFGGGQDGHVRRDTHVIVDAGEIGLALSGKDLEEGENARTNETILGGISIDGKDNPQWLHRGNVYGAGSGIGKYIFDFNNNGTTFTDDLDENGKYDEGEYFDTGTYNGKSVNDVDYSTSAGSVTRFTKVEVNGGTIHRNVYGGGSLASVGPPAIPPNRPELAYKPGTTTRDSEHVKEGESSAAGAGWWSMNTVNVKGTVGTPTDYQEHYGGEVYGASRGDLTLDVEDPTEFGSSVWTQVFIKNGAHIMGNVFGGGDNGKVKRDAEVFIGEPDTTSSSGSGDTPGSGGDPGSDNP